MAAPDTKLFKLLFERAGVIEQFYRNPDRSYVIVGKRYFSKKGTLRLLRYLLPKYRVYKDDNQLVEELYENQAFDFNIRRLTTYSPEPILSEQAHQELEKINQLEPDLREKAHQLWAEKQEKPTSTSSTIQQKPNEISTINQKGLSSGLEQDSQTEAYATQSTPSITEELKLSTKEAEKIIQQTKSNIQTPSFLKNLSVTSQIKIKGLADKYLTPMRAVSLFTGLVGAVVGFGIAGPAGAVAGGASGLAAPTFVTREGGATILQTGGTLANSGSSILGNLTTLPTISPKALKFIFIGVIILIPIFTLGAAPPTGFSQLPAVGGGFAGGAGCPNQTTIDANKVSPTTCRYLNPSINIFDTNISKDAIDAYIIKYSTIFVSAGKGDVAEFRKRVNYIVDSSKTAGLNPALFLGYWKTESNFSTSGNRDMGCLGDNFYEQVDCALGINLFADPAKNPVPNCAKSKDAESVACRTLKGIRSNPRTENRLPLDQANPIKYPISTFDDFAEAYGSRVPDLDGLNTTNNNCISTYNKLLEVATELNACKASLVPQIACPIKGATITNGSKEAGGHCAPGYPLVCLEPDTTGRATAIDVVGVDNTAYLPTINGQNVTWTVTEPGSIIQDAEGGGAAITVETEYNGKKYRMRMVHMDQGLLTPLGVQTNKQFPSNDPIGKYYLSNPFGAHIHITLQEDGKFLPADLYFNLCK